jgi:hypothetical protein
VSASAHPVKNSVQVEGIKKTARCYPPTNQRSLVHTKVSNYWWYQDSSLRFIPPPPLQCSWTISKANSPPRVDPPDPSPPESLGAMVRGGVPSPSAGGPPLAVVPLLAVDPDDGSWSSFRVRYSLHLSGGGGVFGASSDVGRRWLLSL